MSKLAIAVCGPTASGKTGLAMAIAEWLQTEIISFDSRQFYREMKIGTAPPTSVELKRVPHHFIHHISLKEPWDAGRFEEESLKVLARLFQTHNNAVLVGGSGLYLKALCEGFDPLPAVDPSIREGLQKEWQQEGLERLQQELLKKDPEYYREVDLQNPQRVMRALELIRGSGMKYSQLRKKTPKRRDFKILKIAIDWPRDQLYRRIEKRVDQMLENGLVAEARALFPLREYNALQTVGYRELFQHFEGNINLEEAVAEIKKNTRRYAKRQLTWFRNDPEVHWFPPDDFASVQNFLLRRIDVISPD